MRSKVWKVCDGCGKNTRRIRLSKGKFLCWGCYTKVSQMIYQGSRCYKSLQEVLDKVYEVRGYVKKTRKGVVNVVAVFSLPSVMVGRKFKIVLVDDDLQSKKKV